MSNINVYIVNSRCLDIEAKYIKCQILSAFTITIYEYDLIIEKDKTGLVVKCDVRKC